MKTTRTSNKKTTLLSGRRWRLLQLVAFAATVPTTYCKTIFDGIVDGIFDDVTDAIEDAIDDIEDTVGDVGKEIACVLTLTLDCYDGDPEDTELDIEDYIIGNVNEHVAVMHGDVSISPGESEQCLHWSNDGDLGGGIEKSQVDMPVELQPCNSTSSHQEWVFTDPNLSGADYENNYMVNNLKQWSIAQWMDNRSPLCLDTMDSSLSVDQMLTMKDCDETLSSQKWHFDNDGLLRNVVNDEICIADASGVPTVKTCGDSYDLVLKSANNACVAATVSLDDSDNVHEAYMMLANYMDAVTREDIDGGTVLFDDFSLAKYMGQLNEYEEQCSTGISGSENDASAQGLIQLLNYKLVCSNNEETITVFVKDQPRCYSNTCAAGEISLNTYMPLFQKVAIEPTQERANEHHPDVLGDNFTCTGELFESKAPDVCEYQTEKIADTDAIINLSHLLTPTVENTKLFWIIPSPFPTLTQVVTLPNKSELSDPCIAGGGVVAEFPQVDITCTDPLNADEASSMFEVKGHMCLGNLCDSSSGGADSAILEEAKARLIMADVFSSATECTVSGAFSMSLSSTAVGSIAFMWWYTLF